jgi:hypothetical protein
MKTYLKLVSTFLVLWGLIFIAAAQETSLGDQVTKKVGMYVFPANDQSQEQMEKDETECYKWAVEQSGVDPLNAPKVEAEQVPTGPDGAAVVGAAKGAAAGAAIGAICGDTGKGAAIGAVSGGLAGRRASRAGRASAQQSNNQAAENKKTELMNSFKKAYSVCLEGKGYTVK